MGEAQMASPIFLVEYNYKSVDESLRFFVKKPHYYLVISSQFTNFALENNGKRAANIHHIKVDWETRQFYVNYRDNLTRPMAGPIPCGTASEPGDYKGR